MFVVGLAGLTWVVSWAFSYADDWVTGQIRPRKVEGPRGNRPGRGNRRSSHRKP